MGAFVIDGEEYPGRSQGDARRSLDGEPSHVQQDQQAAAAATAAAAQHYYASQQRHGSAPPSAYEWQQLVASMGSVHLGQQHQVFYLVLAARAVYIPAAVDVAVLLFCYLLFPQFPRLVFCVLCPVT